MKKYQELSSLEQHKIISHITNLISLSHIDGKFSKSEMEAVIKVCVRYGVNRQDLVDIVENGSVDYIIPSDSFEKLEQIYDFVSVILADNVLDFKEIELCKNISKLLKLKEQNINNLILTLVEYIRAGKSFEQVKESLYEISNR